MKHKLTKLLLLLTFLCAMFAFSTTANAAEVASGTCGDNLTWSLSDDETLTISGSGAMYDYDDTYATQRTPWYSYKSSIRTITLPKGITAIGNEAFSNCFNLTRMDLPHGITTVGESAFYYCRSLSEITLSESLTSIGNSAFFYCSNLTSITLPDGVTSIGDEAFSGCYSLRNVYYSGTKANFEKIIIGNNNYSLLNANLHTPEENSTGKCGDNLTWTYVYTGTLTISGKGKMYDYDDNYVIKRTPWYGYKSNIKEVVLPDGITTIGDYAFFNCNNLTSITLPDGVTTIGEHAFRSCSNLTSITLPDGITSIGNSAFSGCSNLTSITLPDGITSIGNGAFYDCDNLTSITLPDGITTIGDEAFYYCDNLTSITLPDSITYIGDEVFFCCYNLTSITLPDGVTTIGNYAFSGCSNLLDVYYGGTLADWEKINIYEDNEAILYANLHTVCDGAEVCKAYTDNRNGTHTLVKTCSDCGGSLGTVTETCKDGDRDGLCDSCNSVVTIYELRSLTLRDSGGKAVTSIPVGTFYAEAKVKKLQEADPVLVMLVSYTEDGKMLQTTFLRAEVPAGSTYSQGCLFHNTDGKIGEVKAFVLSSLGNPVPLTEALSVK